LWGGADFLNNFPVDQPAVMSLVNPGAMENSSNRWVREWSAPQGIVDHIALVLARDGGAIGCVGMGRHRDAGPIKEHDIEAVRLLIPHLQRAAAIGRLLQTRNSAADELRVVLDKLAIPVMLLSPDGTVLHTNTAAHKFLDREGPLQVRDGRLYSPEHKLGQAVLRAIKLCERNGSALDQSGFGIPINHLSHGVYALHVLPLGRSSLRAQLVHPRPVQVSLPI
jgi:hypothetical protein